MEYRTPTHKWAAFDLEIAKPIPIMDKWHDQRPLGIACAAIAIADETITHAGPPAEPEEDRRHCGMQIELYQDPQRLSREAANVLLARLEELQRDGYRIVTWNGAAFDFIVLADETGELDRCAALARNHFDLMFYLFCRLGFAIGLNRASLSAGLPGKANGIDGADVPKLWRAGMRRQVIEYLTGDVATTAQLADKISADQRFAFDQRNRRYDVEVRQLRTVAESAQLPAAKPPAWLRDPWSRRRFVEWLAIDWTPGT